MEPLSWRALPVTLLGPAPHHGGRGLRHSSAKPPRLGHTVLVPALPIFGARQRPNALCVRKMHLSVATRYLIHQRGLGIRYGYIGCSPSRKGTCELLDPFHGLIAGSRQT